MLDQWLPIVSAPRSEDLRLSVVDKGEFHALAFPCRQSDRGWIDSRTGKPVDVSPTHWQLWEAAG
jgi:hypothetical protein